MKSNRKVWILLDDDRALLEIVTTLSDIWGKEPLAMRGGTEAMAWLKNFREGRYTGQIPELALIDIRMPGGPQGDEVAREMRLTPGLRGMAIVLMTANFYDGTQESHLLSETGADAFVRKPFPVLDDLKKTLDRAINKRAPMQVKVPGTGGLHGK